MRHRDLGEPDISRPACGNTAKQLPQPDIPRVSESVSKSPEIRRGLCTKMHPFTEDRMQKAK